jgi:type I restriction enzyme M protein
MNLFFHGVEPRIYLGDTIYEPFRAERYDVILTNPVAITSVKSRVPSPINVGQRFPVERRIG